MWIVNIRLFNELRFGRPQIDIVTEHVMRCWEKWHTKKKNGRTRDFRFTDLLSVRSAMNASVSVSEMMWHIYLDSLLSHISLYLRVRSTVHRAQRVFVIIEIELFTFHVIYVFQNYMH